MDIYRLLGVDSNCDENTLKRAYRRKVVELHPDSGGNQEEFVRFQMAWEKFRKSRNSQSVEIKRRRSGVSFGSSVFDIIGV